MRRRVPPHHRLGPVTSSYGNTPHAAPTASPEAGPGRPCSPPASHPPDAATMATGPYHSVRARGWRFPLQSWRQGTARHRQQREPCGGGSERKRSHGGECWRGRDAPGQRSGEGGEDARWSRPASSRCRSCFRALIMGDWGAALAARVLPSRPSPASPRRCHRPPPRLPPPQSLRSGASLPGERPGEAPGSCSGSLNLTRPELRRRERAGKPWAGPRPGPRSRYLGRGIGGTISAPCVGLGNAGASAAPAPAGPPRCPASYEASPGLRTPTPPPVTWRERRRCFAVRLGPPGEEALEAWQVPLGRLNGSPRLQDSGGAGGRNFPSLLRKDSRRAVHQNLSRACAGFCVCLRFSRGGRPSEA